MPKKPTPRMPTIPAFKTESDEAAWWSSPAGKRAVLQALKHGAATGKLRQLGSQLKTVTMRLPVRDLEAARELAERKGLPYQTYITMLLHEAVERERKTA